MSKSKEYSITKLREAIQNFSAKYDSLLPNKKTGSPAEQQSSNSTEEARRFRSVASLTEQDYREQYERQFRIL